VSERVLYSTFGCNRHLYIMRKILCAEVLSIDNKWKRAAEDAAANP